MNQPKTLDQHVFDLLDVVNDLRERVEALESTKVGRKKKALLRPHEVGVCALNEDPESEVNSPPCFDSATCPDSSIYRYQQGCRGTACVEKNHDYYVEYRAKKKQKEEVDSDEG